MLRVLRMTSCNSFWTYNFFESFSLSPLSFSCVCQNNLLHSICDVNETNLIKVQETKVYYQSAGSSCQLPTKVLRRNSIYFILGFLWLILMNHVIRNICALRKLNEIFVNPYYWSTEESSFARDHIHSGYQIVPILTFDGAGCLEILSSQLQ